MPSSTVWLCRTTGVVLLCVAAYSLLLQLVSESPGYFQTALALLLLAWSTRLGWQLVRLDRRAVAGMLPFCLLQVPYLWTPIVQYDVCAGLRGAWTFGADWAVSVGLDVGQVSVRAGFETVEVGPYWIGINWLALALFLVFLRLGRRLTSTVPAPTPHPVPDAT